jgi:hypothetical protein
MLTINFKEQEASAKKINSENIAEFSKCHKALRRTVLVRIREDLHKKIKKVAKGQEITISKTLDLICEMSTILNRDKKL